MEDNLPHPLTASQSVPVPSSMPAATPSPATGNLGNPPSLPQRVSPQPAPLPPSPNVTATTPSTPPPPPVAPVGGVMQKPGGPERARRILKFLFVFAIVVFVGYFGIFLIRGVDIRKIPLIGGLFPPAHREVTLTYWGLWEEPNLMKTLLDDFIKVYTSEHPNVSLTITYEKRSFGTLEQYKETLLTRLRQGTAPDIMRIHNSWVADFSEELAPLPEEVMTEDDYIFAFYPVALTSAKVGEHIYAIPLMYDGLVLFYNKDMFAGVDVTSALSTWEGFRREAVKRTQWVEDDPKKKILRAGAAFGAANNISHASDILSLLIKQSGEDPLTGLDAQTSADALSFYTNFVREDHVWDETLPYSINAFANGQVAMVFGPSWRALDIHNLNPQLKFAAVPVPQLTTAQGDKVHWATFWMEAVNKDSSNSDIAWALLKYLAEKERQQKFYSEAAKTRYFGEPYSLSSLASTLADHEILNPLFEEAKYAISGKTADRSGNKPYVDAFKQAISDVLGGKGAADALKTAQATINQLEGK